MTKPRKKPGKLFTDLEEGLKAALAHTKGRRVSGMRISSVSIAPLQRRQPNQIRDLRTKLRMSQAVFASVLGVSKKAVEAWETGTKRPSGPVLRLFEILAKEAEIVERLGILHHEQHSA